MQIRSLALRDFRSYAEAGIDFADGLTAVVGANGLGKTNLLEAIGFVAGAGSLRGAADGAMIRDGADQAVIRCEALGRGDRAMSLRAEIRRERPNRFELNRQRVERRRDLLAVLTVTMFSPDDLQIVKGEPAARRRWLDDALAAARPASGELRSELDRILRQRNALLRQVGGRLRGDAEVTLDVWDQRLAAVGEELRRRRCELIDAIRPSLAEQYRTVSGHRSEAGAEYSSSWGEETLAVALERARSEDVRRATSTVGPHRDDVRLCVNALPARTHASQGEQRCMALALRLAADALVRDQRGMHTVLLLDDVLSELDKSRAAALLESLPPGQCILTSATDVPEVVHPDLVVRLADGLVRPSADGL